MKSLDERFMADIIIFRLTTHISATVHAEEHHIGLNTSIVNVIGRYDADSSLLLITAAGCDTTGMELRGANARREGIRPIALGRGFAHGHHIPRGLRW